MAARILVLEDHVDTAHALARLLERDGFEVSVAGLLSEALSLCREKHFDVLLVDLELPDGNAMSLPEQVRGHCAAPAIVLSAHGAADRQEEARRRGFAHYLLKPVTMDTIRQAIALVLPDPRASAMARLKAACSRPPGIVRLIA